MTPPVLLPDLIALAADRCPDAPALGDGKQSLDYAGLQSAVQAFSNGVRSLGLQRGERVGIYLEKRFETVIASFGTSRAGGAFVPINPLLKPEQVKYILRDCNVRILVTSPERFGLLDPLGEFCPDLRHIVVTNSTAPHADHQESVTWDHLLASPPQTPIRTIDGDMTAILYTSGSTGKPKGVVLSHRNLVAGAISVSSYLDNTPDDVLLAALPLSFDAGFSQLTTAFHVGARVVLLNYLMPRDVLKALEHERVTGLTAVPPLYIQLARLDWPRSINETLRYFANTGGRMPLETLSTLRATVPAAKPFLMYGLTEAFRSTYLPPEEADRRPDSIGKAIPNVEVLVLRTDGSPCGPNEPGELVHRGPLVARGYWNDPARSAERFRPLPPTCGIETAGCLPETVVFSGDTVRRDAEGFLYFVGRGDDMIKTSGYRISPTEVEEIVYSTGLVGECAAIGLPDPLLGQTVCLIVTALPEADFDRDRLLAECRQRLPAYMVPARIDLFPGLLPRNPNGKIDRKALAAAFP